MQVIIWNEIKRVEVTITGLEDSGSQYVNLLETVHRSTEAIHITTVTQLGSMNWDQKNIKMCLPGRYQL